MSNFKNISSSNTDTVFSEIKFTDILNNSNHPESYSSGIFFFGVDCRKKKKSNKRKNAEIKEKTLKTEYKLLNDTYINLPEKCSDTIKLFPFNCFL